MTPPAALWAHRHVSERETAHRWPTGEADNAAWEDCGPCSAIELARLCHDAAIPATLAEAEALRHDAGLAPTGGMNAEDLARGLARRYGWHIGVTRGFDDLWAALQPGYAAAIGGGMGVFPAGSRWRRWDPPFAGGHNVLVARVDAQPRVWWCDPLAPAGTYQGEWMALADLRTFVNAIAAGHLVAKIRPPVVRDAMLLAVGLLDPQTHQPTKGVRTKAGTKLYDQIDGTSFASLPTVRELPLLAIPEGRTDWRLVLVDTSRGGTDTEVYIHWADVTASFDLPDPTPFGAELKAKLDELDGALVTAQKLAAQAQATATAAQAVITEIRDIVGA